MSDFNTVKPTIEFVGKTGDAQQIEQLRQQFEESTNEVFLRQVSAALRKAQSQTSEADIFNKLDKLLQVAETRRNQLVSIRRTQASNSGSRHSPEFANVLVAEIEFVAATTDDTVLERLLQRIESANDLQALQIAVKKLASVRSDIQFSPTGEAFRQKGLQASDWRNKLRQIEVALETQILDLRSGQTPQESTEGLSTDYVSNGKPVTDVSTAKTTAATFLQTYWWIIPLSLFIIIVLIAVVYRMSNSSSSALLQVPFGNRTSTSSVYNRRNSAVRPFVQTSVPRLGPVSRYF